MSLVRLSCAALAPVVALGALLVAAPTATAAATAGTAAPATASTTAGRYFPIAPTRVLDTRVAGGAFGQGETRSLSLLSAVPAPASAVVLNLTVTDPTAAGFLTVFPTGTDRPQASSLNKNAGETRANSVTVAVGQGTVGGRNVQNSVDIFNSLGSSDVIVDVLGYYSTGVSAPGDGSSYFSLPAPVRLFDTRASIGPLTNTSPKNIMFVYIDYGSPAVNRTISSVVMNMTVTAPGRAGFLTLWNGQGGAPNASTLNFVANQTTANLAIVPVVCSDANCTTVTFSVKNGISPSTQVVGDIAGMYATPSRGGLVYQPVAPVRITDTRVPTPYGRLTQGAAGSTSMNAMAGSTARAVNLNLTAVSPSASTYLSVYPAGVARPTVSNLNVVPGDVVPNAVQVELNSTRAFMTFNAFGSTDVVVDLEGMFNSDPAFAAAAAAPAAARAAGGAVSATVSRG